MTEPELITLGEAMQRLGVSKHTIGRIVRDHGLRLYANPLDKREKLVEAAEIEKLRKPRLLPLENQDSKIAA